MCFIEIPVLNANSVDLDLTPQNAASDLGLHYLPMSHSWDARHKWVKESLPRASCLWNILICVLMK